MRAFLSGLGVTDRSSPKRCATTFTYATDAPKHALRNEALSKGVGTIHAIFCPYGAWRIPRTWYSVIDLATFAATTE